MVDVEIDDVKLIYSMIYDNKKIGNNGYGDFIGKFRVIDQIRDGIYVDDFIGQNLDTGEIFLILSNEVRGLESGISYEVFPLKNLRIKI